MTPTDAITARQMLAIMKPYASLEGKSANAISNRARRLAKKHGLSQYPDPTDSRTFLYSRSQCQRVWEKVKALPVAA